MEQMIALPRAAVAALVELDRIWGYDETGCAYCGELWNRTNTTPDSIVHQERCPVRIVQEALKQP